MCAVQRSEPHTGHPTTPPALAEMNTLTAAAEALAAQAMCGGKAQRLELHPSSSSEDFMECLTPSNDDTAAPVRKRRRVASKAAASTKVLDGSQRPACPIRTTEAAPAQARGSGQESAGSEGEVTLRRCLHLLQFRDQDLSARPARILQEIVPAQLFAEWPKKKRAVSKVGGDEVMRADRWANSGGVSAAHDYFPDGQSPGALGVRKRYGRIVRASLPCVILTNSTSIY